MWWHIVVFRQPWKISTETDSSEEIYLHSNSVLGRKAGDKQPRLLLPTLLFRVYTDQNRRGCIPDLAAIVL